MVLQDKNMHQGVDLHLGNMLEFQIIMKFAVIRIDMYPSCKRLLWKEGKRGHEDTLGIYNIKISNEKLVL